MTRGLEVETEPFTLNSFPLINCYPSSTVDKECLANRLLTLRLCLYTKGLVKGQSAKEFADTEKDPAVCCLEALFLS